jgi:beta-glucuronidase
MFSRRSFLLTGAAAAPFADAPRLAAAESPVAAAQQDVSLNGPWSFRLDGQESWRTVEVPHTWQIEPDNTAYRGVAWYRREFHVPESWRDCAVRIEFEAVFHTAAVSVNGTAAGEHLGKGYTAFTMDATSLLRYGAANTLLVKVDSGFNENMLPRGRSSDWAHDGGIYRPVQLLVTPKVFVERVAIDAESAEVEVTAVVRNVSAHAWSGKLAFGIDDGTAADASVSVAAGETKTVRQVLTMREPRLWHFDQPNLYCLTAQLSNGHALETTFGVRKIEIRGTAFYLNGERVRLMGVERMAGSNPEYGMAEPESWIAHDHADMKALNCVYTRVHWPQDRRTLDWCDRHGILIQTEVPTWGPATFRGMQEHPDEALMQNGIEQLREMVARDRNHPCIFSWGVCNEIGGQNPPAYEFARRMYEESKRLDPKRLVTYASHSLFKTPAKDVAGLMDYVMCNQYVGSWQKGWTPEVVALLESLHEAFPTKPVVISEYGYCACTADRPEGDGRRIAVMLTQDEIFRKYDFVAGAIFFCYNDYRTHVGDKGVGVMQQRVHGVVDVYGNRKLSWADLRREASPVELFEVNGRLGELTVRLKTRAALPAYALHGYKVRAVVYGYGDIPLERVEVALPDLAPGVEHTETVKFAETRPVRVEVDLLRPTGFSAASGAWGV